MINVKEQVYIQVHNQVQSSVLSIIKDRKFQQIWSQIYYDQIYDINSILSIDSTIKL
jgi:hypothetical protein